jgi:hypothetical protein
VLLLLLLLLLLIFFAFGNSSVGGVAVLVVVVLLLVGGLDVKETSDTVLGLGKISILEAGGTTIDDMSVVSDEGCSRWGDVCDEKSPPPNTNLAPVPPMEEIEDVGRNIGDEN